MTILLEKETGMGGSWVLVDYGDNFFAYGHKQDLQSFLGFPVDQCGTKKEVLAHCNLIRKMCERNINQYQKEFVKRKNKSTSGITFLIESEQKELEMLIDFAKILSQ